MHDAIKSMSKSRGYSSASGSGGPRQVEDLKQVVRRLQRESAANAELATQSQSALEALRSDNSALRKAVKTMSNVFMEVSPIRLCMSGTGTQVADVATYVCRKSIRSTKKSTPSSSRFTNKLPNNKRS